MSENVNYPKTLTVAQFDSYHGQRIADPYRWLEQSADTPEVSNWISEQNALTQAFLASIPERESIRQRLTELWNYPKYSAPFKKGDYYFQFRNSGLQNQYVLYVMHSATDEGKILLDPNKLSSDGTLALNNLSVSSDGKYLAYAVSQSGSDWQSWLIREVDSGKDLAEKLEWSKFSGATWLPDSSGFIYARYPQPKQAETHLETNEQQKLYLHHLATEQSSDQLIYENPDEPKWLLEALISDDKQYLILAIARDTSPVNLIYYKALASSEDFKPLIADWEASYVFLGNDAEIFYFQTTLEADCGRIIAIDLKNPSKANWQTLVEESTDTLQTAKWVNGQFLCLYLQHASHVLKRYDAAAKPLGDVPLPGLGSIEAIHSNPHDETFFYSFTSFLYPSLSFSFNTQTGETTLLNKASIDFDSELYESKQVFAVSKDGTRVPIFLVHKKDLKKNGQNPCLLYGYGGFKIALSPSFSVSKLIWLELGGVLAIANLRGGGEYGNAWHQAGRLHQKQNVFDDFIASAEFLISEGYSSTDKLAIQGGSNGGLLVGAAMTQRPELFAAALPAVGVMDMLRFHLFTIGWAWVSDYGSADDPEQFKTLLAYSPLHNLKASAYPATLITTGDHDDRVVPAHSFKFAAALQAAQTGPKPCLIRIQTKAGHGAGKPTSMLIEEQTDIWGFLVKVLGISMT